MTAWAALAGSHRETILIALVKDGSWDGTSALQSPRFQAHEIEPSL